MGDTPTTPVIRLGGRPFRACNPKSEHLQSAPNIAFVGNMDVNFI